MINLIAVAEANTRSAEACLDCAMRPTCITANLDDDDTIRVARLIERRRTLPRGEWLYRAGASTRGRIYALRRGDLKIVRDCADGTQCIDRFQHEGELVGLDTIGLVQYANSAETLNTVEVCELPFSALQRMASGHAGLRATLFGAMQRQLQQQRAITLLLHNNNVQQRLVTTLLALASTQGARSGDALHLRLPMSRQDLAEHLGMGRVTVSRLLSQLQSQGLLRVSGRLLTIPQPAALAAHCGLEHPGAPATATARHD